MSEATKRKHVIKEVFLDDFELLNKNQQVVKMIIGKGNNLHEVEPANGPHFLASMPTKFRRNVWTKRGDFVVIEPIEEGDRVKGEIVKILTPEYIKFLQENNQWPEKFTIKKEKDSEEEFKNTNRKHYDDALSSSSGSSSESENETSDSSREEDEEDDVEDEKEEKRDKDEHGT